MRQLYILKFLFVFLAVPLVFTSCGTRKQIVYFQDLNGDSISLANTSYSAILRADDIINVTVMAEDMESAIPFNYPKDIGTQARMNNAGMNALMPVLSGYLIDENGDVELPILGTVSVAGLTRKQATEMLKEKYEVYLKKPVVKLNIMNFRITVLGDVNQPGSLTVPNEKLTILEAIGIAGDLAITAKRKNILVLREENGKTVEYRVDVTSKDILSSPVYYLKQNDIIYVEPNATSRTRAAFWRTTGTFFSLFSFLTSTVLIIINL